MTRRFRSSNSSMPPSSSPVPSAFSVDRDDDGYFGDFNTDDEEEEEDDDSYNPATTPFISPSLNSCDQQPHFSLLALVATALRKSLVTCAVEDEDVVSDVDIGWPTEVRHVSHVTFDRFHGFLGLPVELQPDLPRKPPSASASVFGVSAQSMQCFYDHRGNSVPVILLQMQNRLYSEGGLQAEGIFRINAENSEEENVRKQLNRGVVPHGIDVHCLSGLIKAWFRELPSGVLDSLTPEQVMNCNTEDECAHLVNLLPPTDAALLDWAVNLMADVVQQEHENKMNARNIAMVFAPNMTQMADPLTALIHAVQVMNFLKTLIVKTLHERQHQLTGTPNSLVIAQEDTQSQVTGHEHGTAPASDNAVLRNRSSASERLECDESLCSKSTNRSSNAGEKSKWASSGTRKKRTLGSSFKEECNMEAEEGILHRLSFRKGMLKLSRHPVFQLSKTFKKNGELEL